MPSYRFSINIFKNQIQESAYSVTFGAIVDECLELARSISSAVFSHVRHSSVFTQSIARITDSYIILT